MDSSSHLHRQLFGYDSGDVLLPHLEHLQRAVHIEADCLHWAAVCYEP